jgi:hypothetical protein
VTLLVKHSLAVMVFKGNQVLTVRRPNDDDELPGIWGLPAGTFRPNESVTDVIHRIGQQKLGVKLTPRRKLGSGSQSRPMYELQMELWEASMEGVPTYLEWQWGPVDWLISGARAGSLCCELAIQNQKPH